MALDPALLDEVIESWPRAGLSEHLRSEIGYVGYGGHLGPGDPVPGCLCDDCTGVVDPGPSRSVSQPDEDWEARTQRARGLSILEVATRLGIKLERRGHEYWGRSPYREDRNPSLRVNAEKGVWRDDPADEGGDAIALWMRVRKVDFGTAIRQMTA